MKNKKANIEGELKEFAFRQIDSNGFKVTAFTNERPEQIFTVSLLPTGNDEELPAYNLYPKDQDVPQWATDFMPEISKWISEERIK
ncbi:MAG: hypothetical protein ABIT08_12240 [Bacteroidia bacterium]